MHLEIRHRTRYTYDCVVQLLPHLFYLRPRAHPELTVHRYSLVTSPVAEMQWMRDDFDNLPASARFAANDNVLEIESHFTVTTADMPVFNFLVRDYAQSFPFAYEPLHRFNLAPCLSLPEETTQTALRQWLATHHASPPSGTVAWIFALNQLVCRSFRYVRRDEPGIQAPTATLAAGSGSCRDLAVFLMVCLRTAGLAARFVSGYLFDPANARGNPGAMHAWVEVFLPGAGWKGVDPTHGIFCSDAHVPVAHAAVAESVNPIQGSFFSMNPASSSFITEVQIQRLHAVSAPEIVPVLG